jgi:hypothetical protein
MSRSSCRTTFQPGRHLDDGVDARRRRSHGRVLPGAGNQRPELLDVPRAEDAWSINPGTIGLLFEQTGGTHPIFNPLDADNPEADPFTVEARRDGVQHDADARRVRRGGAPPRAPYFHNGIAATLEDVVRHYEAHLGFVFTSQQRANLVAFLKAL